MNRLARAWILYLLAFGYLILTGCQTEDLRLSPLPPEKRTLYLQNFSNATFEADVHMELVEALRARFDQRRGYILVPSQDEARFILYGEVAVYRREGFLFDNEYSPTRYDLNMVVRIRMIERESGKTIAAFEEDGRVQYSVREGMSEEEIAARQRLYGSLTRKVYARLSEAFPGD